MTVIACLTVEPTEAVLAACARLTPVVEPRSDRVLMDWTGCGPVDALARRLHRSLSAVAASDAGAGSGAAAGPRATARGAARSPGGQRRFRLGVAPLRFVAEVLADPKTAPNAGGSLSVPIAGGRFVPEQTLHRFVQKLPLARLPDIDAALCQTLAGFAVHTLGDVQAVPLDLLRDHLGAAADALRAWAQGRDDRPVKPLYPRERLQRRISGDAWLPDLIAGRGEAVASLLEAAVLPLTRQLQREGKAASHAAVAIAFDGRFSSPASSAVRSRVFPEPTADDGSIVRAVQTLGRQLLAETFLSPSPARSDPLRGAQIGAEEDAPFGTTDSSLWRSELLVELIPVPVVLKQSRLWDGPRPRNARHARLQRALDGLRSRFGDAIGFHEPREAVLRYEAMRRLYGAEG